MSATYRIRRGITLVEILVAIAIMAVLVGLLLVAVQKVRVSGVQAQNKNNLRQMILAVHQIADEDAGDIKKLAKADMKGVHFGNASLSLYYRMIPIVHGVMVFPSNPTPEAVLEFSQPIVKVYQNPADPSWSHDPMFGPIRTKVSYAFNMVAFNGSISLVSSIPDGTSQTIAIGDKYFARGGNEPSGPKTYHVYDQIFEPSRSDNIAGARRPTFVDRAWGDVMPVTDTKTHTTRASVPGKTYDVAKRPEDVDPHILSTPYHSGLTVALFDGSVRTLSPNISESSFWTMITPAAGDIGNRD